MQQRNLTVVVTDLKGFTSRTSRQSRADTVELVTRLQELLLPILTARGGRLVKSIGDGFLLTFESPTNAVLAGIALQETLRRHNAMSEPERRLEVRVAVNTGEVSLLDDGDILGEAVNIAARLQEAAAPNEVYLTEATYLSMNIAECPAVALGSRTFKGLARPVTLYKALLRDGRRRRGRGRWLVLAGVLGLGVLWWIIRSAVPSPEEPPPAELAPAAEPPVEVPPPAEELAPEAAIEPPAEPDPSMLAAIAQTVQVFEEALSTLEGELRQTQEQFYDWSRELSNQRVRCRRLSGQVSEMTRAIPSVREHHTQAAQRLIDQANGREDRGTADALWRELGQFDVAIGQMEAQAASWAPVVEEAAAALQTWEPLVTEWSNTLAALRQERGGYASQMAALKALTAWDAQLDAMGPALDQLRARLAEVQQTLWGLKADLDARAPTLDGAEQFSQSWQDFRDQWRAYLYAR